MPIDNDGVMIILSSPSGAGKTTLQVYSKLDNFEISISHTTREPRPSEFLTKIIILLMRMSLKD